MGLLEEQLMRDVVAPSPGCAVGTACLSAMAALACGESGSPEIRAR